MDVVRLARLKFSLTIMFHFLFLPITIGLALLIFMLETARLIGMPFVIGTTIFSYRWFTGPVKLDEHSD